MAPSASKHHRWAGITITVAALLTATIGCGSEEASPPATAATPPPTTAPSTTGSPTTGSPTTVSSTTVDGVILLDDAVGPPREPTTELAVFEVGDDPDELGVQRPAESAGRGPGNPVLLTDGSILLPDGVNDRATVLSPTGTWTTSALPLITADCASTGPMGIVYIAGVDGISAWSVDAGAVRLVAGPSGGAAAMSPSMGLPGPVPAFEDAQARAPGSQPLPLVDWNGVHLVPPAADRVEVTRSTPTLADGIEFRLTRRSATGQEIANWRVHLPVAADAPWGPALVWVDILGDDGLVAVWDVMVEGEVQFLAARFGADGLMRAFTIPVTWRLEGEQCTSPAADMDRLVALVPVEGSALPGETIGFRLLEWEWAN